LASRGDFELVVERVTDVNGVDLVGINLAAARDTGGLNVVVLAVPFVLVAAAIGFRLPLKQWS